ncbi:MAG: MBL fold metallo-hydrolase [Fusobacteriaceae bacterium]
MKISILGSGSSGNSIFIDTNQFKFLVDAGFSCKKIEERLLEIGENLKDISALLITHEHGDHIMGAGIISRKYNIPIYISRESYEVYKIKLGTIEKGNLIFIEGDFDLSKSIKIQPFDVLHDATRTLGFKILGANGKSAAISTDIGYINNINKEYFKNIDLLVIESNYDYDMLMSCSYPWDLKSRIKSNNGHLSNTDAGNFIRDIYSEKLQKAYLVHVSKDSNHPTLVLETVKKILHENNIKLNLEVAHQDKASSLFKIE